jgi:hypothetical protein
VGGITVEFGGPVSSGEISVVPCDGAYASPPGFTTVSSAGVVDCWNIHKSASITFTPPVTVCIHYPQVGPECPTPSVRTVPECTYQLAHNDGTGPKVITGTLDTANNIICASTASLSPFAIVVPSDTTGPVFSNVPGPITAFATSTSGAKITYALPKAVDAVDATRQVTCTPASGTTFLPGKKTVTCTASDNSSNKSQVGFEVWVQYQAPTDGTFFLPPIRPNGTSIFRVGRPVPVRFKLTGASAGITNLTAKLIVTKIANTVQGTTVDASDETVDDTDFIFKFRPALKLYVYRWKTLNQTQGTYQLKADLGDEVLHQINVSLRAP